jgi:CHAT domain-containing protein/tetratricopeptide (TPR) repeat protein
MRRLCLVLALCLASVPRATRGSEPEPTRLGRRPVSRDVRPEETHNYLLAADRDEWIQVLAVQISADVVVKLLDPTGQVLLRYDDVRGKDGLAEEVYFVTGAAGDYRLEVSPTNWESGGRYEMRLVDRHPASPRDQRWFEAAKLLVKADDAAFGDASDLRAGVALCATALEEWRALGDRQREMRALDRLGVFHSKFGEREKALAEYESALAIARQIDDAEMEWIASFNLATEYGLFGEQRKAIEVLLPMLAKGREKHQGHVICHVENNLAFMLAQLGEFQDALAHAREGVEACRPFMPDESLAVAHSLVSRGNLYRRLGIEERALEANAELLSYARSMDVHVQRTRGLAMLASRALAGAGLIRIRQGELRMAADAFKEALQFAEASGQPLPLAVAQTGMGRVLTQLGETAQAADYLDKALETAERTSSRGEMVEALLYRGDLRLATGPLDAARQDFERALSDSRSFFYPHFEATALHGLARVAVASGRLDEALQRSEEAISIAESLGAKVLSRQTRAEYLATVRPYYELAVEVLMSLHAAQPRAGYDGRALQMSERGRARSLLEGLIATAEAKPARIDDELARKRRELRDRLSGQATRLFRLQNQNPPAADVPAVRKEIESLLDQLQEIEGRSEADARAGAASQANGFSLAEFQRRVLDERSLLLVYALGEPRSYVWVVSRASLVSRELPGRAAIDAEARRMHEALAVRSRPRFETPERRRRRVAGADREAADAGRKLSEMLLGPVAGELSDRRLLVVADESLERVPFAALPEPAVTSPADRRPSEPLVARHEVQRVPSAAALIHWVQLPPPSAAKTLAVFADPVFDRADPRVGARVADSAQGFESDWRRELTRPLQHSGLAADGRLPRLPHTREEARALSALIPKKQRHVALGFDASRQAALSPELASYEFVHFATHAVLDETTPGLSSVVLSLVDREGRERDGFLKAEDVSEMHLAAELVTLSGCSTGLGKQVRGEGTLGLVHSFLRGGARRVLLSLWDVDDRATAAFMAQFYGAMLGPRHLSPAAALREAQMTMRASERWSAPHFWAGFVLTGDPSEVSVPSQGRRSAPARSRRPRG